MDVLERDHYCDQLLELLSMATAGHGRMGLISGEAGIGKTALVEEFVTLHCSAARRLWGACEALFTPRPLGPLYDIATQVQGRLSTLMDCDTERPTLFSAFLEELQKSSLPTVLVFEDVHCSVRCVSDAAAFTAAGHWRDSPRSSPFDPHKSGWSDGSATGGPAADGRGFIQC